MGNPVSGIWEFFVVESRILGFRIRNTGSSRNPEHTNDWNSFFKFNWKRIWYTLHGIRSVKRGIPLCHFTGRITAQDKFVIVEFTLIVASWVIRARGREIRRFVIEFKGRYLFLRTYIWCFLFEKSNLRVQRNNTLTLKCKEVRDQFLENLGFPIHSVIRQCQNYLKCMEICRFLKTDHGLFCTPDLVYSLFDLVSYSFQRESIKYMNSGKNSWLWVLKQIF